MNGYRIAVYRDWTYVISQCRFHVGERQKGRTALLSALARAAGRLGSRDGWDGLIRYLAVEEFSGCLRPKRVFV